jgi:hypothetical protein
VPPGGCDSSEILRGPVASCMSDPLCILGVFTNLNHIAWCCPHAVLISYDCKITEPNLRSCICALGTLGKDSLRTHNVQDASFPFIRASGGSQLLNNIRN